MLNTIDELPTVQDFKDLAAQYIQMYFHDKKNYDGRDFTLAELTNNRFIGLVLNNDICSGVDKIYKTLDTSDRFAFIKKADDIKLVISMLDDCARRSIPKQFASGLILMYLELCKGYVLMN